MEFKDKNYLFLILLHALIGVLVYSIPGFSKLYGFSILFVSLYFIIKTRNRNNEVLYAAAYIVGSEVFLRMTNGNISHEFSKYGVMLFLSMGMFYSGFSKNAVPYWIYLILLIPGVIIATYTLNLTTVDIRKTIMFNISGPLCLGFASLYCYNRKISIGEINNILLVMGLPIIACTIYLILYTPSDIKTVLTGTGSNAETSGGFGPNQVSTALGLGMFIFFARVMLISRTKLLFATNLIIAVLMTYRGLITFSRGGVITGFLMLIILLYFVYINSKYKGKVKLNYMIVLTGLLMLGIWFYTESKTDGLISKRYQNKDALGRVKGSNFTGREEIAASEINAFLDNPFFGIGVAKGTELRLEQTGEVVASHNEITRLLCEHGSLGALILLILFSTPIFLYLDNKQNIYLFCFLIFWLLTINHAAMRTASPSFIYALSLLKIQFKQDEEVALHRE
ncbi:O-antigen ligase [Flavobacterium sp.]|uniref:O-antigen ligase family protein n=1 Tax=Flavobacterium sp. TaxID=239 RepID=UPI0026075565|nr:O-antigen ligase family protein [Flavobacterium sp.]